MEPQYLEPFSEFSELETLLNNLKFPNALQNRFKCLKQNRCVTFGLIKNRITKQIGPSAITLRNIELFDKLMEIGETICPFKFTTIHINKNVVAPKHKDSLVNRSPSVIVSFGDYTGGELIIEQGGKNIIYNCKNKPLIFDGRYFFHWNNPIYSGTKYSLIFYNIIDGQVDESIFI